MVVELIAITATAAIAVIFALSSYRTARRLTNTMEKISAWTGPASVVVETFSKRLRTVEERLGELRLKTDLMEAKLTGTGPRRAASTPSRIRSELQKAAEIFSGATREPEIPLASHATRPITTTRRAGIELRRAILGAVSSGSKTAREVQAITGKSREHTSRTLKELYEGGIITRSPTRPYRYSLSEKG